MNCYPWYEVIDCGLGVKQGDFIFDCPVVIPPLNFEADEIEADVKNYDVIVMSHTCDIENNKLEMVLVCPFWSLAEFGSFGDHYKTPKGKEDLRRGRLPGYHLLNKCSKDSFNMLEDFLVVDFRSVYGMSIGFFKQITSKQTKRLRLLPPYREHLSQAFAKFFMRVGLPEDIPPFKN